MAAWLMPPGRTHGENGDKPKRQREYQIRAHPAPSRPCAVDQRAGNGIIKGIHNTANDRGIAQHIRTGAEKRGLEEEKVCAVEGLPVLIAEA